MAEARKRKASGEELLDMRGISKSYPGVQALEAADFSVRRGEIHGLVGKNGAGKSTLMGVLMGIRDADSGSVAIEGQRLRHASPQTMLDAGISYVPQHINLLNTLTVAENILVGNLPRKRFGLVDWKATYADSQQRLSRLGLTLDVRQLVEGLSVAERTMLAIAKALFNNARLIILDEPTAALSRVDIDLLFGFVRAQQEQGVAFIYISHHLEEVFEICDRVTVMRDGRIVGTREIDEIDVPDLIHMMVGGGVKEYERDSTAGAEVVFEVKDLSRRGAYEHVDFALRRGEVIGVSGLQGSGVDELAQGLFGLERMGAGEALVDGAAYRPDSPKGAFDAGVAYLPQDRHRYGLVQLRSVRENVTYSVLDRLVGRLGILMRGDEQAMTEEYIDKLGIVTPGPEQQTLLLSGGNQQKVVFAKLAATQPKVLILHEPTQGVDVQAKVDIFNIINDLSAQGVATMIISSEVRELIGLCDRILVMYEGRITREFSRAAADMKPEDILLAIEGGPVDASD